jgi:FAD/FMN-containing dehydrogenase
MAFLKSQQTIDRTGENARLLAAAGLKCPNPAGFGGQLVCPNDPGYNKDRQIFNPAFQAYPAVIAYCEHLSDVPWCLNLAQQNSMAFTCRSGGHSTAGYSTINNGLLIDLSRINAVMFMPPFLPPPQGNPLLLVGPGASFASINQTLNQYGAHIPGGGCGDVCIGGYMQGGGYGFTSRQFGINSDNVIMFQMVLANGQPVFAAPTLNGDLFWAVRGGTGNNFGVLTAVWYKVQSLSSVYGVWLQWPMSSAAQALVALQAGYMTSGAPDNFGYMSMICEQNGVYYLMMRAMYTGSSQQDLQQILAPLLAIPGAGPPAGTPMIQSGTYYDMNIALLETPLPIPQLDPNVSWAEDKQAGYIAQTLTQGQWQIMIDYYMTSSLPGRMVVIEPYGGAINRYPIGDSAFIHRNPSMDFFVDVFWDVNGGGEAAAKQWLNGFMQVMQPFFDGEIYQNYPRGTITDYQEAYWAAAYPTLVKVKQKYDPNNFFNFPQSIGLSSAGYPIGPIPTSADKFLSQPISYAAVTPTP